MKILFVAHAGSIHTARWTNQLADTGWTVHLVHSEALPTVVADELAVGTVHMPTPVQAPAGVTVQVAALPERCATLRRTWRKAMGRPAEARDPWKMHVDYFVDLLQRVRPDVIHSLGLNVHWRNQCRLVLESRERLGGRFPGLWVYSSWGTDLDYYSRLSDRNRAEVQTVVQTCDAYIAECRRDERLAREFGLRGRFLGHFPAFGGVSLNGCASARRSGPVAARRTLIIKGRDCARGGDPVGRAMTAMRVLAADPALVRNYTIAVLQPSPVVEWECLHQNVTNGARFHLLPRLPYDQVLRLIGASRALVALTVNDGLPSTLVEAMALGALPICGDVESVREYIRHGENGLLVPPEDPAAVKDALQRALGDDALVERAAEINARIIREQLSDAVVRPRVLEMYRKLAAGVT